MGLKTTNYEVKKLGIVLPQAYAIIKNLRIDGNNGTAEFAVQSTRDTATSLSPIETVKVSFEVNRNENPYITAYEKAKSQREERQWNEETHKIETVLVGEHFYGWEDDIVFEDEQL